MAARFRSLASACWEEACNAIVFEVTGFREPVASLEEVCSEWDETEQQE